MNATNATELAPPPPPKSVRESIAAYFELLDLSEVFVRGGLRSQLGPGADIDAAYREWNREYIRRAAEEKVRHLREQLANGGGDAG